MRKYILVSVELLLSSRMPYFRLLLFMAARGNGNQRHRKKENFLRQFRDEQSKEFKQLTASQFMEIWSHYDTDSMNET
jgi:hypothetical protein